MLPLVLSSPNTAVGFGCGVFLEGIPDCFPVGILGAVGHERRNSRLSHYHETSGLAQTREESVHTYLRHITINPPDGI